MTINIHNFGHQMTRLIPSFAGFTAFTPVIPKLYWDVKSAEQRTLAMCELLGKVIAYADMLGENVDEIKQMMQEILDGTLDPMIEAAIEQWFEDNQPEIMADIAALQIKTTANEKAIFGMANCENTRAYCRDEIEIEGTRYSPQGYDAFLYDGHLVSVVYLANPDDVNGIMRSYFDDTLVTSRPVTHGHGSHIAIYDNYAYVTDMRTGVNLLYRYPISNTGTLGTGEIVCDWQGGAIDFDPVTGKAYSIGHAQLNPPEPGRVYEVDLTNGVRTIVCEPDFRAPVNSHVTPPVYMENGQSGFVVHWQDKVYFGFLYSFPNYISLVNEDGTFVKFISLGEYASYIAIGEAQNFHVDADMNYFFNGAGESANATWTTKTWIGFTGNLFDMSSSIYPSESDKIAVIRWYPYHSEYKFPFKSGAGYISSNPVIKCYYGQDVQSIINSTLSNWESIVIELEAEDTEDQTVKNGLFLTGYNGEIDFNSHLVPFVQLDKCIVLIRGCKNQLESKADAIHARIGTQVASTAVWTGVKGLRLTRATAIVRSLQDIQYIEVDILGGAQSGLIVKSDN